MGCERQGTPGLSVEIPDECKPLLQEVGSPPEIVGEDPLVRIVKFQAALDIANERIKASQNCIDLIIARYKQAGG